MQTIKRIAQRYQKSVILVLILGLLGTGSAIYIKKTGAPVVKETTVSVARGDIQATVSATGSISAVNSVDVSSRVTGLLTDLRVKENDYVKAGQVLMVLDDTVLRAQVTQYLTQMQNYAAIYERSKKLSAINGQSVQQLETDRTSYLVAKSTYENYAAQLDYYVIKAPIDGVVIGEPTPAGETVVQGLSAAQTLLVIADMSKMQVKAQVDETDIGKVKAGQTVSFTVDAYSDKSFSGRVRQISKSATTSSNVIYYTVYIDVDSPQDLLYPTMTARVNLHVGESKNVLTVPLSAVKEEKGQKLVQVLVGAQVKNLPVTVGLSDDENIEISSGLNEGDNVVLPAAAPKTTTDQGPPPRI